MTLTALDIIIIVAYFALSLGVGLWYRDRASRSMTDYFISGRALPWWLAGTSMVATTFAADTPLAVTGLVAQNGLAGNWFWWAFALGGMITVFLYARLWRRAEVLTDVQLVELRYSGKPAAFLRGFRALYISLLVNSIIIGWVTVAMLKVLKYTVFSGTAALGGAWDWWLIVVMLAMVGVYSTLSGLWGVVWTDFLQFGLAMLGFIVLAFVAVAKLGGIDAMQAQVIANFPGGEQAFRFLPEFSAKNPWMPIDIFLIMMFIQWWASWYPGAEPGGGGYIVQRMASAKDERHSLLATLWFQIAHYTVRPWPWLILSFCALAMYPQLRSLPDPGVGMPMIIKDIAPVGIRGLILVAFLAAFMSTIATQINWGASYLVNDFYARFINRTADDRHLTRASRLASVLVLVLGGIATWLMRGFSVDQAWKFLAALGAGTGAVFMLRWYWWRINAWTEIVAMVASLVFFVIVSSFVERNEYRLAIVAFFTIGAWLIATFVTRPEKPEVLEKFYRKVRPGGPGWKPIATRAPDVAADRNLGTSIMAALFATGIVYLVLPGIGHLIFGHWLAAVATLAGAAVCAAIMVALMKRIGWATIVH